MPIVECDMPDCFAIIEGMSTKEFLFNLISQMKQNGIDACLRTAIQSRASNYRAEMGEGDIIFVKPNIHAKGWGVVYFEEKVVIFCPECAPMIQIKLWAEEDGKKKEWGSA